MPERIEYWLPAHDVATSHERLIAAPAARVFEALRTANLAEPLVVRLLMAMRALPTLLARTTPRSPRSSTVKGRTTLLSIGFTLLDELPPTDLVLGLQGRFWELRGGLQHVDRAAFELPTPPAVARAIWSFSLEERGLATMLRTETRVRCGDPETRRRFLLYWRLISPFSGVIRRAMLAAVARASAAPV